MAQGVSWIAAVVLLAMGAVQNSREQLLETGYKIPLPGGYVLVRGSTDSPDPYSSPCLVDATGAIVLEHVSKIATAGVRLVGISGGSYFLCDTSAPSVPPTLFTTEAKWKTAIESLAGSPVTLSDPDTIAASLPDRIVRPFRFRVMGAGLGLDDEQWALIIDGIGALAMLFVGFVGAPLRTRLTCSVVLGVGIGLFAGLIVGDGGTEAIGAPVFLTLVYYAFSLLAHIVGRRVRKKTTGGRRIDGGAEPASVSEAQVR